MARVHGVSSLTQITDRYPRDVGQDGMAALVMRMSAGNLYDYLTGAWPPPPVPPPPTPRRS